MELQAIRYASMVSAMTFERAEQIHGEFLARMGEPAEEARTRMLTFLGWESPTKRTSLRMYASRAGLRRFRKGTHNRRALVARSGDRHSMRPPAPLSGRRETAD